MLPNLNEKPYSVSRLNKEIRILLESEFPQLLIEGEIGNYKLHSSGHAYFTLKDDSAQVSCVMWKNFVSGLRFSPEPGMKVMIQGAVTVYERGGNYQIKVMRMQPAGIGELQLAFEKLKQKLQDEGLFAVEHKKQIPFFPEKIGMITSATGAAVRDIISVIKRRMPPVELILFPVHVQGDEAAAEIAHAIQIFNEKVDVDLLIVGRGGGSLEDLWAFNEEIVARAIFNSKIPIISAVGHEVDFSIADFVADVRAATPSAAAELAVPDKEEMIRQLDFFSQQLQSSMQQKISDYRHALRAIGDKPIFTNPYEILTQKIQTLDIYEERLKRSIQYLIELKKKHLQIYSGQLNALNPDAILKRGYTIIYKNDKVIESAKELHKNESVRIHFYDGEHLAEIKSHVEKSS